MHAPVQSVLKSGSFAKAYLVMETFSPLLFYFNSPSAKNRGVSNGITMPRVINSLRREKYETRHILANPRRIFLPCINRSSDRFVTTSTLKRVVASARGKLGASARSSASLRLIIDPNHRIVRVSKYPRSSHVGVYLCSSSVVYLPSTFHSLSAPFHPPVLPCPLTLLTSEPCKRLLAFSNLAEGLTGRIEL